jgi:hypothetical protein
MLEKNIFIHEEGTNKFLKKYSSIKSRIMENVKIILMES